MSLIDTELQAFLPPKRKQTPSGWISFNAVCCHNNGENRDTKKRGGVLMGPDSFQYHCFNCGFKAGWTKGKLLSKNTRTLFAWLGMTETRISELAMTAMREQEDIPKLKKTYSLDLQEKQLPNNCLAFAEVENTSEEFIKVVEYVLDRGMGLDWYNWMWADEPGWRDRVIIPFYHQGKVVGYTGRKITDGKPKYLTDAQPGYVFNLDSQHEDRQYVIVMEGQFDAIAVGGCAISHNEPNESQIMRLNALGREVIVVPDRDKPGAKMLKSVLENGWSMSLPEWEEDIKDVADAVKRYGRLYTLIKIINSRTSNKIKIELEKKKLEKLDG
jgi:hypothetical protein